MHSNNTNYQCKMSLNKALTFGVGSIKLSFRIYHCVHPIHAKIFSIQMLLHFSQIVPKVCTLVLSFYFVVRFLSLRHLRLISFQIIINNFISNNNILTSRFAASSCGGPPVAKRPRSQNIASGASK